MDKRFHSVRLDKSRCKGCTSCLMHCPTEAIRVRGGRAHIIDERCIDCGECIRICNYHAKVAMTDPLSMIQDWEHRVALPAPSLYGQFRHVTSIKAVKEALLALGFQEVYEVAKGADIVTCAVRRRLKDPKRPRPLISSACPAVTRMIQVRFPALIPHIVDVRQPMEVAAAAARLAYQKKYGVDRDKIGVFFITPCPAKMTAIRNPIGHEKSEVTGCISMVDMYGALMEHLKERPLTEDETDATPFGVGWARSGGEARAAVHQNFMAVDGIEDVIEVLEEIENGQLTDMDFFEGAACPGGCIGGPLTCENKHLARNKVRMLVDSLPQVHPDDAVAAKELNALPLYFNRDIPPNAAMQLHESITSAMERMERMEEILKKLPGYDCGSCGSPTCRSFAEDMVRGYCAENDCIFILKDRLKVMAQQMVDIAQTLREEEKK